MTQTPRKPRRLVTARRTLTVGTLAAGLATAAHAAVRGWRVEERKIGAERNVVRRVLRVRQRRVRVLAQHRLGGDGEDLEAGERVGRGEDVVEGSCEGRD